LAGFFWHTAECGGGGVVAGFGPLSEDNQINFTMEWVAEGLALAFVGVLAALAASVSRLDGIGERVVGRHDRAAKKTILGKLEVAGYLTASKARRFSVQGWSVLRR
jgi:hypothetical protein